MMEVFLAYGGFIVIAVGIGLAIWGYRRGEFNERK